MPYLSFDSENDSTPHAIIKGGKLHKKVLYINPKDGLKGGNVPKKSINPLNYDKEFKTLGLKPIERTKLISKLEQAYYNNIPPEMLLENDNIKNLYSKIKDTEKKDKSIALPTGSMFQIIPSPSPTKREVYYITGASGSGKSYTAKGLAEHYKKFHPDREIYLISKLNEDETLDSMKIGKPQRINVQSLVDEPPELEEFRDCMVIFDDYDSFDGQLAKTIQTLINDLCIQGRHTNTTLVLCTHFTTNYKQTRLILGEVTHFVIFPSSTSPKALKYLLDSHVGMGKDDLNSIRKMGRWVCVSKNHPQYLISEHSAKLLNQVEEE
jgi:hypothetical protein